ncbi:glycosyl transferase family protein [Leptolyngbya sp. Heron Island J]|uniref:glycosyltransferase family 2 protein n=1 Tax=Leptolyngbya sp. Heron Island J TaxID=1385935 RepID=UPI0003B9BCFF|nr:glycosyltransferase family 2 protein [Leptolyngbya sp. Heron Island J]ESA35481.1 glycosyl transferase family protein [Leptolyngbya sp. Heron Island J]
MAELSISAIICTHNRDQYLGAAIDSLLAQTLEDIEVIVVDNASTDTTAEVVQPRLSDPRLRYVYEPTLGLSTARNTGANTANGDILAYLDDDAIASAQWLASLVEVYEKDSKVAIAGGKVTLLWPPGVHRPPAWLSDDLASGLGAYDLGNQVQYIKNPNLTPRGLNYSLRKTFLDSVGGFDVNLGRIGKNLLSNEELHMTQLALKNSWHVVYVPDALAAHNVSPARLKPGWFLSRSWWQGISECYREQVSGRAGVAQLKWGGERLVRGVYKTVKYVNDPAQRFENLAYAYGQLGYLGSVLRYLVKPYKSAKSSA